MVYYRFNTQVDEAHFGTTRILLRLLLDLRVIGSYTWRADTSILRVVCLDPATLCAHPIGNLEDD